MQQVIWMTRDYYGVVPAQPPRVVGPVGDSTKVGQGHQLQNMLARSYSRAISHCFLLSRSMSAGVTYWVPDIHCMLLIVGRGGMTKSGLSRTSFVRSL